MAFQRTDVTPGVLLASPRGLWPRWQIWLARCARENRIENIIQNTLDNRTDLTIDDPGKNKEYDTSKCKSKLR